jgi:hypothetical protein
VSSGLGEKTLVYQSQLQEELVGELEIAKKKRARGSRMKILLLKGIFRFMGRG